MLTAVLAPRHGGAALGHETAERLVRDHVHPRRRRTRRRRGAMANANHVLAPVATKPTVPVEEEQRLFGERRGRLVSGVAVRWGSQYAAIVRDHFDRLAFDEPRRDAREPVALLGSYF